VLGLGNKRKGSLRSQGKILGPLALPAACLQIRWWKEKEREPPTYFKDFPAGRGRLATRAKNAPREFAATRVATELRADSTENAKGIRELVGGEKALAEPIQNTGD